MTFSEKLTDLRRKSGMSQEQLADRLGVTRQSVSKWESGTAMPELVKLISLSELFDVSVDYLVKDRLDSPEEAERGGDDLSARQADRLEKKVDELTRYVKGKVYRYDSKTRIFGLPLVSIRFGFVRNATFSKDNVARGIIAIGNAAVGVVAIGIVGVGLFTFGVVGMGLLSLGIVAAGLGAFGVAALGYLALGVSAVGVYTGGVAAIAAKIAVAVSAVAPTAVGEFASGSHVLLWGDGLSAPEVRSFLLEHHPDLWEPLLDLFASLGAHIK
ncbi:MAG TPA: helix-turn-helix domain-containing protein [Candidatus Oscillibacter pullicola]|nr:helix-turn-helix domain-containing protein [Candidatus Oscillibacter pullicola]